ncbi:MAG: glycosyltransferase family 4 protein [Muribaculaceae bacterium]|nr:glycosyltransferase family 4 protein [Muribaculaceae bacterium]
MNILFLTLPHISDISTRGIYTDLMREFVRRGHTPYIVCPVERRIHLPEKVVDSCGAKILHVKTLNIQKTNMAEKCIGMFLMEYQYMNALRRHWSSVHFDLCIYSTPPITFNKVIAWQKKKGVPTYLMLKDIFPQAVVDLEVFTKRNPLYWLFRRKEKLLYKQSDRIGCMSPANVQFVIRNNPEIDPRKVELCPNSIELRTDHENYLNGIDRDAIREKYGIPSNKPLFIYGGNLGKPQAIDFLIILLHELRNCDDLHMCVVGSGTESGKLHAWCNKENPKAVTVMEALPKDDYDKLVASADVGMIFLDRRYTIPNFPSRLLSYLENKQPVFLATDKSTDIGRIATTNKFGLWCESEDLSTAIAHIKRLASDAPLRKEMGENGYRFLLNNYTVDKSVNVILKSIDKGL